MRAVAHNVRWRRLLPALALVAATAVAPASAQTATRCTFDGPVPGYRAMRVELPQGSDFLTLELQGTRTPRPVNDDSGWHLAEGIFVVDAVTRELVAHQVSYAGTSPPVVLVEADGEMVARQSVIAPEGPWIHGSREAATELAPGTYDIVAFGAGGPTSGALAQWWGASVYLEGAHACSASAAGEVFDHDQTDFDGGTQVHAPGVGVGEDLGLSFTTARPLVVGLLDAGFQGQSSGEVSLDYKTPAGSGQLGRGIVPFVSTAGTHEFKTSYRGVHPIVGVAGVAVELPAVPGGSS